MNIGKTFYPKSRKEWRSWLLKNYKTEKEIWLIHYNKASGKYSLPYDDAVEEAMCFGWIDSSVKKLDEDGRAQRYTPRREKSLISELNKERLRRLVKKKKVMPEILTKIQTELNKEFELPESILNEIKKDKQAWENFQKFPKHYQVIRIAFVEDARKRPEMFKQRLNYLLKMTSKNKKFGTLQ
ncbi:MAG TPA: YdeI/OmpD-associated family protein [Patescibacteria group bacterium]|nr:YdeI/OmpD-associated family protein [Patescibacteria group bacterium]